ncbi:MAG TPA: M23 family metallopeptidase, partial [Prolixibacteraceae bacterium]
MRVFLSILVLIICPLSELSAQDTSGNDSFTSPLKPPHFFSGDFGELRLNHFHSGLDYRTGGQTGLPVFAVKEGYVSRIGISSTGYGNALYLNHPDGTTSVYGHLERFQPKIQEYVKDKQYDRESFQVNITLSPGEFHIKKGEIIAWTGNSGSSGGPHLHFEIRNTKSERAYNPLFYNLGIKDNSAPKIASLYVYPLTANSNVGQDRNKKRFETVPVPGGYRLKMNLPIGLFGKIGFGIQADDDFNGVGLKCGIYSATLFCDGQQVFGFKMNNFSFDDSRYANSQADYEEYLKSHHWIQRLYKQPGNQIDIYDTDDKNGILNLDDGKGHEFEIVVADAFKNKSILKFHTSSKKSSLPVKNQSSGKLFHYDHANVFENNKIRIDIPAGALYDNLEFVWKSSPKPAGCYSELQQVNSKFIPLQKPYTLSVKCDRIPENLR